MLVFVLLTFHARGASCGGAGDLPGEAGTLDGLGALLDLLLIAAAMDSHHLACPLLHLVGDWPQAHGERERDRQTLVSQSGRSRFCFTFASFVEPK